MLGTKLNAQVIVKNLQNMHAKSLPPTGARLRVGGRGLGDWSRNIKTASGPACKAEDHTRADPKTA
jgi:hypothetical protein